MTKIETKKLYKADNVSYSVLTINSKLLTELGFDPNSIVTIVYEKEKLTILSENKATNLLQNKGGD